MNESKLFRVLHLNMAYGTMTQGDLSDITKYHRFFWRSKSTKAKFTKKFLELVLAHAPDSLFLSEIKLSDPLIEKLKEVYPYYDLSQKYRSKNFRWSQNSNAYFSKEKPIFHSFFHLEQGVKTVVKEVKFSEKHHFVFGHFSLKHETRKKQFAELNQKYGAQKNVIICGDFNTFRGLEEFEIFENHHPQINKSTFPAQNPKYILDNFLSHKNFSTQVIPTVISDHRAILIDVPN